MRNASQHFICRNAGNIVPPHMMHTGGMTASIEFAVAALQVARELPAPPDLIVAFGVLAARRHRARGGRVPHCRRPLGPGAREPDRRRRPGRVRLGLRRGPAAALPRVHHLVRPQPLPGERAVTTTAAVQSPLTPEEFAALKKEVAERNKPRIRPARILLQAVLVNEGLAATG
mgnify:CR=1 FL=1